VSVVKLDRSMAIENRILTSIGRDGVTAVEEIEARWTDFCGLLEDRLHRGAPHLGASLGLRALL
jgi:hypothetical protein